MLKFLPSEIPYENPIGGVKDLEKHSWNTIWNMVWNSIYPLKKNHNYIGAYRMNEDYTILHIIL